MLSKFRNFDIIDELENELESKTKELNATKSALNVMQDEVNYLRGIVDRMLVSKGVLDIPDPDEDTEIINEDEVEQEGDTLIESVG